MTDEDVVFLLPIPKPEFRNLSQDEVLVALQERRSRKHRLIASEVARLAADYVANFKAYVDAHGREPFVLEVTVSCPIEKIAVRLMMAAVSAHGSKEPTTLQ